MLPDTIAALIFDLDDTLYPELQYVRSGFQVVAARLADDQHDRDTIGKMLWQTFQTGPRDRVFNTVLQQLNRADEPQVIDELVGVYRCHRPQLQLEFEVQALLAKLKRNYKLGLITDGFLPTQQLKVEALSLEHFFDHIIYTEQLGRQFWKPSPKAFELMAQTLDLNHSQCAYIADNPAKDFIAPNQLGWHTIQLLRPDRVHADTVPPAGGQPQQTINDLNELVCTS